MDPRAWPRLGVFAFLDGLTAAEARRFAGTVERLGYGALWVVEAMGRDVLVHAGQLLAATERLVVGSGVASVWAREASQAAAAARTLAEGSGGRFVLGLGVNNPRTAALRGLPYHRPVPFVRDYLARVHAAAYVAPAPADEPPVVLAALHPRMLSLAGEAAAGTLTYFVPPGHTAHARAVLGPDRWVCVEQAVLLERDARAARAAARAYMSTYVPHIGVYVRMLGRLGFGDADFAGGLSDRLVDAVVAWGDETALRARIDAHYAAGATHVSVLPLGPGGATMPDVRVLEALAPAGAGQ